MIGRSVSRYRVLEKLGEGGMATVWKAEDSLLGRAVAIKILAPGLASSQDARRRFLREARAASTLNHPGICGIYDAGEADDQVYMALAWIDGQTVSALAERSALAISDVIRIGAEVADALGYAHAHGVVHRDVTGRNIMKARDGRVFVLDLGLALAVGQSRLTSSGNRQIGTLAYLSPEVARGGVADSRSDLYGLGVVLYEAATGTLPFENARAETVLYSIVNDPPEPPSQRRRDIPPALEAVVMRLLAKRPEDRFANAHELADELRRIAPSSMLREGSPRWVDTPTGPGSVDRQRYVAVLPFEIANPDGADAEHRLFVRGLAEVLATAIARVPGLQVVPPALAASVESTSDLQHLARELGANQVLRATVRRSGLQLRVTWSLLDPTRGIQVAGETVEGASGDAFGLEDRLSESVLTALGDPQAAASRRKPPRDPAAHERVLQAIGYLSKHEDEASVDAAIGILERLRASEEPSGTVEAALGRAYLHKCQLTKEARWEALAAAACERAIAIDPSAPDALVTLGDLCAITGQNLRAIEAYERALAIHPDRPEASIGLGRTLIAAGRIEEAEETLKKAVEKRPNFWDTHNALGRFYVRVGRYHEALASFERVVQIAPDNARGWRNLATPLFSLDRYEEALEACRRSIEIRPHPISLTNLGTVLFYLGRYEEAVRAFERAVTLQPADPILWGNIGSSFLFIPGHEHRAADALERAVSLVRERLQRNPNDAREWSRLAGWLSNLDRHPEARTSMERALALEPANPEFMAQACAVHHQAGERDQALHWLRESLAHGFGAAKLERDPHLKALREDPEYQRILTEETQRHGSDFPVRRRIHEEEGFEKAPPA